ncbi:MAG: RagB/SusD family nutrient uptake outer membrane protein [Gemmatimonadota bacterium]|nr:RagB/SusD family nutrient uptake outer membrane protein [Gemmatimonadota bacterium]
MTACNDITHLEQSNPGQLGPGVFAPENADLIVNSAKGDFQCAFNEYIGATGTFVDELRSAISSVANFDLDRRTITPSSPYGTGDCTSQQLAALYTPLSIARASNDVALQHLEGWTDTQVPDRDHLIAVAASYAGYSLTLLGESMCSAAINLGPEELPPQLFADAKARFDTAVAAATRAGDNETLNLALVGRARTELDLGDGASAATDAALVPAGFEISIDHDATAVRRQNLVWAQTILQQYSSVDTSIINRDTTDHDPRIAVTNAGALGSDGVTDIWTANKDNQGTSPQRLASYEEAQLIIAENDANTGGLPAAKDIINAILHSPELGADTSTYNPGTLTQAGVLAEIVEQRKREFFLEGHRLGDIRRLNLPMAPAAGAPFQVTNGVYSSQTCFPLPDIERINNPNLSRTH